MESFLDARFTPNTHLGVSADKNPGRPAAPAAALAKPMLCRVSPSCCAAAAAGMLLRLLRVKTHTTTTGQHSESATKSESAAQQLARQQLTNSG